MKRRAIAFTIAFLWQETCITSQQEQCACAPEDIIIKRSSCDPSNTTDCTERCTNLHGVDDTFLADKCCIHAGRHASFLAFEDDAQWVPRIDEYRRCTGATVRLEYLDEGEDGMAEALLMDVGDSRNYVGEGIFDAYIVQGPWLPPVVNNLVNLSPLIRKDADTVQFMDINQASRSAVSYNGTVRALPLDTDYIALGWREDSFAKHKVDEVVSDGRNVVPPTTIDDLANLAEYLNHKDHNGDDETDWGICLTPQVNYFYAFVAPILQTHLKDVHMGTSTGQNIFFDSDTFEPLIRIPGFKKAVETYYRIILASNCQTQIANGEKCDRKTAFPSGRCPMVISMPGTLTKMLLNDAKYAPTNRTGEFPWSVMNQPLLNESSYWGRRAAFPGSNVVQSWDTDNNILVPCLDDPTKCPHAGLDGVNYAPFFSEGGEAYALSGRSDSFVQNVMWDLFAWLSTLPIDKLPLSGQYRKSHLSESSGEDLQTRAGWPKQMVTDLFDVLHNYFKSEEEGGNPVQDLFILGFADYMNALDEELHGRLFDVGKTKYEGPREEGERGLFNRTYPASSITSQNNPNAFNAAYEAFVDRLEERYDAVTKQNGGIEQLERWRQSLNLPWKDKAQLCQDALVKSPESFFNRLNCLAYADVDALCLEPSYAAHLNEHNSELCPSNKIQTNYTAVAVMVPLLVVMLGIGAYVYNERKKREDGSIWEVKLSELKFAEPPVIVGRGTFGLVLLAQYRGTSVAIKRVIPHLLQNDYSGKRGRINESGTSNSTSWTGSGSGNAFGGLSRIDGKFKFHKTRPTDDHEKLKKDFITEMHHLSTLRHPNITTVMGAVIDKNEEPMLVMEYMDYGSLYDILHNDTMPLEGDLLLPILRDIAQGILFLHAAEPQVIHGDLKAANILVDSKFRAKVADFGLSQKGEVGSTGTLFWMAPELLRQESRNTAASDVYSFGIILYELYSRKDPYEGEKQQEVINGVIDQDIQKRPPVPKAAPPMAGGIMKECLLDDPEGRPSFTEMDLRLKRISVESVEPGNMNLSIQGQRVFREKRAQHLLNDVFPPHIADALRDGRKVEQEQHECVTIFFSDIVGFTTISQSITPQKVCNMLGRLYLKFDDLSRQHDILKIETIGDAYMAITNLTKDQRNNHVKICAEFSKDAIKAAQETQIDLNDISKGFVEIRVGFHSGPVISDVVGSRLPKFGVFGDTVNTASRMESNSAPSCIHCSELSAKLLMVQAPDIFLESRGTIRIKGKGEMHTYWVDKERDRDSDGKKVTRIKAKSLISPSLI